MAGGWTQKGGRLINPAPASLQLPVMLLTGERGAGGGVEAVAAVGAVAAGDVIVRVFDRRERRAVVHLFISSFEAEGRTFLHGNAVSEGAAIKETP